MEEDFLISQFLKGALSPEEAAGVEARMQEDASFREKVMLEKQFLQSLDDKDWSFSESGDHEETKAYAELFRSEETQELKQVLARVSAEQTQGRKNILKSVWFYTSAAAFLLIMFLVFYPSRSTQENLYEEFLNRTGTVSLVERGNDETEGIYKEAITLFDSVRYQEALELFEQLSKENVERSALYIYHGITQIELELYTEAITTFDDLINSDFLDAEKGHWYKVLVWVKAQEWDKAKEALDIVIDNQYYKHELARELKEKLPN